MSQSTPSKSSGDPVRQLIERWQAEGYTHCYRLRNGRIQPCLPSTPLATRLLLSASQRGTRFLCLGSEEAFSMLDTSVNEGCVY